MWPNARKKWYTHVQGGGLAGTVGFVLPACYHQTLGIFREVWHFRNLLVKKYTLPRSNHFFTIQWEINFFTFKNIDRNSSKKIENRNTDLLISNLLSESIFNWFKKKTWMIMAVFLFYFFKSFCQYFKKSKMNFPLYFQKVIWPG